MAYSHGLLFCIHGDETYCQVVSFFNENYSINLIEFFNECLRNTNYPFSAPHALI